MTIVAMEWFCLHCNFPCQTTKLSITETFGDAGLYRRVAGRVHNGENYYDAAASELRARGYPTSSIFHWRMPVYAWIFGKLPSPNWGWAILVLCGFTALTLACSFAGHEGGRTMQVATGLALAGSYAWLIDPEPTYFMELWCGIFITISACLYALGKWKWGVLAGALALFLRELALPYCALSLLLAWLNRRGKETVVWLFVFLMYLVIFYMHFNEVRHRNLKVSASRELDWIAFNGTAFVLSTCQMSFPLMSLPPWCTAVYLPLALLGLLGWDSHAALPLKLTALIYILLFSVVGKPFNCYWGWLYTPLLALGIVWSPLALRDLVKNCTNLRDPWRWT